MLARTRTILGLAAIAVCAVLGLAQRSREADRNLSSADRIALLAERWHERRAAIEEEIGGLEGTRLGYKHVAPPSSRSALPYFVAQYVLAPAWVDQATDLEWVLGDFANAAARRAWLQKHERFQVARNLGEGAVLLRRDSAP